MMFESAADAQYTCERLDAKSIDGALDGQQRATWSR
jgi:hypothetical protein